MGVYPYIVIRTIFYASAEAFRLNYEGCATWRKLALPIFMDGTEEGVVSFFSTLMELTSWLGAPENAAQ